MEKLEVLQAEYDLWQDTLEKLICHIFISGTRVFTYDLQQIRNRQSGHHAANARVDKFQHVGAAPSIDNAYSTMGRFKDGLHLPRHHGLFKLQILKVRMLAVERFYELH